ncbi:hypothetical protein L6164_026384 [Bauhinia variegata]|uniref:Uncharacterized protein n=1 Tax=Bauhinia variegata TaxID=167791 RepID=A0ACB9LRI9_BAUVA|nr:hypothetical protein L6164_026384 [Bauhinia variegata]
MESFVHFLLLFLRIFKSEMGPIVAEARSCDSPSHRFKGICLSSRNCASVCQTEGFPRGNCRGFRRRCLCSKPC